jgi:hypothetical protein
MSEFKGLCISLSAVVSSIGIFKLYGKLFDGVAIGAAETVCTITASLFFATMLAWPSGTPISRWYQNSWRFWSRTLGFMGWQSLAVLPFLDGEAGKTLAYVTTCCITMFLASLLMTLGYSDEERSASHSAKP